MNYKHFSDVYVNENQFSREKLQFFFDRAFHHKDEIQLRYLYKTLRNLDFFCDLDFSPEIVDISTLCENLTTAFDIFASQKGKSFIYCGNSTAPIHGSYRFVTKAFLNLLSNAFLHGTGSLVTVKAIEDSHFVKIEIRSEGQIPLNTPDGNGLSLVRKICTRLNGHFFIEAHHDSTVAIMIFRKSEINSKSITDDYILTNLLSNRLSPVYVEIFGMNCQ